MENSKKITVNGQEYDLPDGVRVISDDGLYSVDWNLIEIAKEVSGSKELEFFNPRHLGQYVYSDDSQVFLGQGFDKESMKELITDIIQNGLDYPLLAYWVIRNGKIKVCVNDGERRWRCLDRLNEKNEKVWSAQYSAFLPAKEVYAQILCRVKVMTEEEALQRACAVSDTSVKWGEGATARLVKTLYEKGKKDDDICKLLNKGKLWLADTYSLNELDEVCFNFLLAGKINRTAALELLKIKDVKIRQNWLQRAWQDATDNHEKVQTKNERLLEKAERAEEVADAELELAKQSESENVAELETTATAAGEKTKKRKEAKAASAKPTIKGPNLRRAAGGLLNNALRPPKIKKKLKAVEELIEKNDTSLADIKTLKTLAIAYQCILDGEEDITNVLKKISA
jgi:hypothetical protein